MLCCYVVMPSKMHKCLYAFQGDLGWHGLSPPYQAYQKKFEQLKKLPTQVIYINLLIWTCGVVITQTCTVVALKCFFNFPFRISQETTQRKASWRKASGTWNTFNLDPGGSPDFMTLSHNTKKPTLHYSGSTQTPKNLIAGRFVDKWQFLTVSSIYYLI